MQTDQNFHIVNLLIWKKIFYVLFIFHFQFFFFFIKRLSSSDQACIITDRILSRFNQNLHEDSHFKTTKA